MLCNRVTVVNSTSKTLCRILLILLRVYLCFLTCVCPSLSVFAPLSLGLVISRLFVNVSRCFYFVFFSPLLFLGFNTSYISVSIRVRSGTQTNHLCVQNTLLEQMVTMFIYML